MSRSIGEQTSLSYPLTCPCSCCTALTRSKDSRLTTISVSKIAHSPGNGPVNRSCSTLVRGGVC